MAALLTVRFCAIVLLSGAALAKKGGKQSKVDTSEVLNPDPEAPNADDTSEYNDGPDMVEGDMKITGGRKAGARDRNAAADPNKLWPQGVVPYILAPSAQSQKVRNVIQQAIADYNQYTCVKFQPRRNEPDYVKFTTEHTGCWSRLGRDGDEQELNLGRGCVYKGTTIHEMMHAIGFEHEQKRGDRDRYVTIHFNNVVSDKRHNFDRLKSAEENNQGFGYDYSSLMHYGQHAFARDQNRPTITTRDPRDQDKIGQRAGFSKQDAQEVNRLYKCNGKTSGVKGKNGCLDKDQHYCENVLGLKNQAYPQCTERSKKYCKVSCNVCDPGDGRGGYGKPRPTPKPVPGCDDEDSNYCKNTVGLKDGPNAHCQYADTRDYCKKSCHAC